jgi:membrane protein YqaA with SNARE-associated domain
MSEEQHTKSRFLIKNLLRGLIWFAVIITAFIYAEEYIQDNFAKDIEAVHNRPILVYAVFFSSEVVFGLVPPEFFMMIWVLHKVALSQYVINLTILTVLSYIAGMIGYSIGKNFSKSAFYARISEKYLSQYHVDLARYGGYLVFVGAVTPIPFSATCMLAGSVNLPFRNFLLISIARILRFLVYGWMVWSFPNWFSF